MARNPFSFLDSESQESVLLLLLQALIRRSDGQVELSLEELTAVNDGDSLMRYPSDKGDRLVLRFARRGAAAYYRKGDEPSTSTATATRRPDPSPRHAIHDDIDLALREEEMAQRAKAQAEERLRQARAEAGAMPWRTRQ